MLGSTTPVDHLATEAAPVPGAGGGGEALEGVRAAVDTLLTRYLADRVDDLSRLDPALQRRVQAGQVVDAVGEIPREQRVDGGTDPLQRLPTTAGPRHRGRFRREVVDRRGGSEHQVLVSFLVRSSAGFSWRSSPLRRPADAGTSPRVRRMCPVNTTVR